MIDNYRKLIKAFKDNFNNNVDDNERLEVYDNLAEKASSLLNDDFIKQIRDLWEYDLKKDSWNKKANREKLKNISRSDFVSDYRYNSSIKKFIEKHWNEIDRIIKLLQDYVIEIEEEEKKENEKQTNKYEHIEEEE